MKQFQLKKWLIVSFDFWHYDLFMDRTSGSCDLINYRTLCMLCIRKDSPQQAVYVDPDQTPQNSVSDQGLHGLLLIH